MKIYLLDINKEMTDAWYKYFKDTDVEIINDYFDRFMHQHPEVDGIVSPANSFGLMTGGYDKAIIDYLGTGAQTNVLTILDAVYKGYQPVGTCLPVPYAKYIILHTPTMRTPETIDDYRVVYDCMYSCLLKAEETKCECIVIPAFGALTGRVPYDSVARKMYLAYKHIYNPPIDKRAGWDYAMSVARELKFREF